MQKRIALFEGKYIKNLSLFLMFAATFIATVLKIFVSVDIDEEYAVLLGARLAQGEVFFTDIRDMHLTSSLPAGLFCLIYHAIVGSYDCVIIFMRLFTAILIDVYAYVFWRITSRYYYKTWIPAFLIANFTFKGILNLEFSFIASYLMLWICLLLLYLQKEREHLPRKKVFAISAVCVLLYGCVVLAYPTMVATILLVPFVIWYVCRDWKQTWKILGICALVGLCCIGLVLFVVLQKTSPALFIDLIGQFLNGNHAKLRSFSEAVFSDPRSLQMWFVILGSLSLFALNMYLLCLESAQEQSKKCSIEDMQSEKEMESKKDMQSEKDMESEKNMKPKKEKNPFLVKPSREMVMRYLGMIPTYAILVNALMVICFNVLYIITGKTTTVLIRYILIYLFAFFLIKKSDKDLIGTFVLPGFGMLVGSMLGSDGGIANLVHFTFPVLLAVVIWIIEYCHRMSLEEGQYYVWLYTKVALVLFVLAFATNRGNNIRVTDGLASNMTEERIPVSAGPCKGLYLLKTDAEHYSRKVEQIREHAVGAEKITYLGAGYQTLNLCTDAKACVAFSGGADSLGVGWTWFFETHELPDVFFLDKYTYVDTDVMLMDSFLEELFSNADKWGYTLFETDDLYILSRLWTEGDSLL